VTGYAHVIQELIEEFFVHGGSPLLLFFVTVPHTLTFFNQKSYGKFSAKPANGFRKTDNGKL
jgi:hypothetical protein